MNNKNLKPEPFVAGSEKAREAGRKGGIKSGEARRKRRELRETLEILLSMPIDKGTLKDIEKLKSLAALKDQNITAQDAMSYALIMTAMQGGRDGVAAFKTINDTLEQNNEQITADGYTNLFDTDFLKEKTDEELRRLIDKGGDSNE